MNISSKVSYKLKQLRRKLNNLIMFYKRKCIIGFTIIMDAYVTIYFIFCLHEYTFSIRDNNNGL